MHRPLRQAQGRLFLSRLRAGGLPRIAVRGLPLALAAGLALTAGACMSPSAKKSAAEGTAGERAARAGSGQQSGAEGGKADPGSRSGVKGKDLTWWQRITRSQQPKEKPWVYGDVRPGKGLLSNDEDGYTLYRQGNAGSSARNKPAKVRR